MSSTVCVASDIAGEALRIAQPPCCAAGRAAAVLRRRRPWLPTPVVRLDE
ncbi:hypothetical protein JOD63_001452 [Microbacterium terrae]|nr:hypothetical protein [Microbacterium terrae]MBP1077484.1 hypothetical protein [Microbacterium terrae]